ncbi:MAG: ATP-binding protein [Chloroflexota bacterium]|nr:ATP-binding protein [Chloroflexota bacterium]
MSKKDKDKNNQAHADYIEAVAPEAVEVREDRLVFPEGVMLPLSVRCTETPGMKRPWGQLSVRTFQDANLPLVYSVTMQRKAPDSLRGGMRARRTLFEGFLTALNMKIGRRPSMAEHATSQAMDAVESQLSLGAAAFQATLLAALFTDAERDSQADGARRVLESSLRAKGFTPQRLFYIAERALQYLQPGGNLFPGMDEPILMLDEAVPLLPPPSRQILPSSDAIFIGPHAGDGHDIYFSFKDGLDPTTPPPPHAMTLILGEMGSGKTTLMRWILLQRLLQGRTIVTIDPEGENNGFCRAVGGSVVPAKSPDDPNTCLIHPLHIQADEGPAEMLLAVRFLVSAIGGDSVLTPGVQAALHEAVKRRWERRPGPMSLADLVDALGAVNASETSIPIALLQPYMRGGLWDGFFDRPKALLSPDFPAGEWRSFDLSSLRDENKAIVQAILAWFLHHAVTVGKRPMDIFIDEGWRLLRSGPFADMLDELGRRARKRGIGISFVTHLPEDLMKNPTSLSMASTAFIGRMGPDEAFKFFRSMGVPEGEAETNAEQVAHLPPHVFLAAPSGGRGALFPVLIALPPSWLQFLDSLGGIQHGSTTE